MNSKIVILTGPSGTGKTTLINNLKEHLKSKGLYPMVFESPARKVIDTNLDELRNEHVAYFLKQLVIIDSFINRDKVIDELNDVVTKEDKLVVIVDRCMLDNLVYLSTYLNVLDLPRELRMGYLDVVENALRYVKDFDAYFKPQYFLLCPVNTTAIEADGIRPANLKEAQQKEYVSFLEHIEKTDLAVTQIEEMDRINFNTIVYDSIKDFQN